MDIMNTILLPYKISWKSYVLLLYIFPESALKYLTQALKGLRLLQHNKDQMYNYFTVPSPGQCYYVENILHSAMF